MDDLPDKDDLGVCMYSAAHALRGVPAVTILDCGRVGLVASCQACADFYARMG